MPDKPIASLVKYYYLWKNKRKKSSVIDRQARKLASNRANENQTGSREGSSSAESELDDKVKKKIIFDLQRPYHTIPCNCKHVFVG